MVPLHFTLGKARSHWVIRFSREWTGTDSCFEKPILASFFFFLIGRQLLQNAVWFLLYNKVNQLEVCIYSIPLEPPSHPPSHSSRSSQHTKLSSLCSAAASHQLPILYTQCYSLSSSHPLLPLLCPQVHSLCLCLCSCSAQVHQSHFSRFPIYAVISGSCCPAQGAQLDAL